MKYILCWCFLSVLFLSSCAEVDSSALQKEKYEGPQVQAINVEIIYSDSAKVRVRLKAPLRIMWQTGNQDFPKGMTINFFNKKGENEARLTAQKGRYDKEKKRYTAMGDVVLVNLLRNEVLKTELLHWTPETRDIFTDKFVTITTPRDIIKGTGLKAKQDLTSYRIDYPTGIVAVDK